MTIPKSVGFVLAIFMVMLTVKLTWSLHNLSNLQCLENEWQALLSFKHDLRDPSNRLSSWEGRDCCKWHGVGCDNKTRHVVKLNLRNPFPFGVSVLENENISYEDSSLHIVEVSHSLAELKHLKYLDFSLNDFSGSRIPSFFGSFKKLEYLNLSSALFGGLVPHHLGNLSSLSSLDLSDLSGNPFQLTLDTFLWISNLSSLQHLDMSGLDLTNVQAHSSQITALLPYSLTELRLSFCRLTHPFLTKTIGNMTSLRVLDLSDNNIGGPFPNVFHNMTSLKTLDLSLNHLTSNGPVFYELKSLRNLKTVDLSFNQFEGVLPNFSSQLKHLERLSLSVNSFHGPIPTSYGTFPNMEELDLGWNALTGSIPSSLGSLSALKLLDLAFNKLSGPIPTSIGNLSNLKYLYLNNNQLSSQIPVSLGELLRGPISASFGTLPNMKGLDLSMNALTGSIPSSLGHLSELESLHLHSNRLSGSIPTSIGNMSNLEVLDLRANQLSGHIPMSLVKLVNLEGLFLSDNLMDGVVSEVHLAKLSKLKFLYLSDNSLTLKLTPDWAPSFQLEEIDLAYCNVGPQFPDWLRTQTQFTRLNLINASISDSIPDWFKELPSGLVHLDLSRNQIHGKVPNLSIRGFSHLDYLDLSKNHFSGELPRCLNNSKPSLVDFSFNHLTGSIPDSFCDLQNFYLSLSKNMFSGELPQCWNNSNLQFVDFSYNQLAGTTHNFFVQLPKVETLYLSHNFFHGVIHKDLENCTNLIKLDLGQNSLSGEIPSGIGEHLSDLSILRLRSNNFIGGISTKLCNLKYLQILDIAENNLSGIVPQCFGNFSGMVFKQTYTPGYANYTGAGILTEVMKGRELEYTGTLKFLVNLDLSSNNLRGHIPKELTKLSGLIGLNLSRNHLTGTIPSNISNMSQLESLDFSSNNLSGTIPQSILSLTFLSHLNLSYNNLSGRIPSGNQLQIFINSSIYQGNSDLCGPPLAKKCFDDQLPHAPTFVDDKGRQEDHSNMKFFFIIGVVSGFVVGFWGVCGVLLLKKTWRYAYFRFVDNIQDKVFVAISVRVVRLKEKLKKAQLNRQI